MIAVFLAACASALGAPTPTVGDARVLGVRATPAEVSPGDDVALTALYADSSGTLSTGDVDWSFCTARKPLDELGPVSPACLDAGSDDLVDIGTGLDVDGAVPDDACANFGPLPPPSVDGSSAGRPVDPDATGGFYQPAIGFYSGDPALVDVRIRCGLANASQETYIAWNLGYHDNTAPAIAGLSMTAGGSTVDVPEEGAGDAPIVSPGDAVTLAVSWPACPTSPACGDGYCQAGEDAVGCPVDCAEPVGCGGAETYAVYDAATGELNDRREAISATWYATAGDFANARDGVAGDDLSTSTADTWTAPSTAGDVSLWVVLRDERGGAAFGGYRFTVAP